MPIYTFRCAEPACGHEDDFITSVAARDGEFVCPKCGGTMKRTINTGIAGYVH